MKEQPLELHYRYESGTINSVGIARLGAGLKFIFKEGMEKILAYEKSLTEQLLEGLSQTPGVTLYTAKDSAKQTAIISFTIEGYEPGEVGAILDQAFDIKARAGLP